MTRDPYDNVVSRTRTNRPSDWVFHPKKKYLRMTRICVLRKSSVLVRYLPHYDIRSLRAKRRRYCDLESVFYLMYFTSKIGISRTECVHTVSRNLYTRQKIMITIASTLQGCEYFFLSGSGEGYHTIVLVSQRNIISGRRIDPLSLLFSCNHHHGATRCHRMIPFSHS